MRNHLEIKQAENSCSFIITGRISSKHRRREEVIWLRSLFPELGWLNVGPSIMYGDNQGAIALAKNPEFHSRTKHIRIQYHFVRQCVADNELKIIYIATEDMIADILTKPLLRVQHQRLCEALGLRALSSTRGGVPLTSL
jgi:hypothetical protein